VGSVLLYPICGCSFDCRQKQERNEYKLVNPFNQHDSEPDEALIRRFQSGDAKAFDRLVLRYQAMVLRVAYKTLQQEDDAKDAAQEIFVKIYRSLAGFKPQARFSTWVYRITVNQCYNVLRSRRRKRWLALLQRDAQEAEVQHTPDPQADPLEEVEKQERIQQVRQALARLPADQRLAMVLHRYEGLSYQEIAEATDSSVAAVESRLHRGRKKLQRLLSAYMEKI